MKGRMLKLVICVWAIVFSALSAGLGYGFMRGSESSFFMKFACGFVFIMTPLLVVQMVIMLYTKNSNGTKK